jgi:hypothetical protein
MARDAGLDWARWKRRGIWVGLTLTTIGAIWAGVTFGWVFGADNAERPRKEQAMGMAMANRAVAARPPLDEDQPTDVQTATFALG